ncbi:MAG TPA: hypothetical protein VGH38_28590 [Bryobacteraceae bacterium]
MRSLAKTIGVAAGLFLPALGLSTDLPYYNVLSGEAGAWSEILSSIGLQAQPAKVAHVFVARPGTPSTPEWPGRIEAGAILILEGESPLAESLGFRSVPGPRKVTVRSLTDTHGPGVPIIWEHSLEVPVIDLPTGAEVFARERWTSIPLSAGIRRGSGAILWIAVPPGERGYERFPYLLDALCDLGLSPPFRSARLWAFFDSSYRLRVDVDYFAKRWRKAGISALHVAAWHYFEPDGERDRYLNSLIAACHREGILVYAWLDLPHVSEKFWDAHPKWREKTALLQDAQLDWRKLMNLTNRDCYHAVAAGVGQLVGRFDWDGINLAELYFESLQGIGNPSRFTPMNDDVRARFRKESGFDPIELFGTRKDDASRQMFLNFRSELAGRMQEEWIGEMENIRRQKPHLDLVLTHVDDRFDPSMRQAIGADAARVLSLLEKHAITFLIEDPATVWHLGAQRYHTISERYRELTPRHEKLAIDLNIVSRYQNVYPTKQQTGTELLQLVHNAAANFQRVALYFESSLVGADLALLPSAAAGGATVGRSGLKTEVNSLIGVGIPWKGPASVDGQPWPVADGETIWLPAGPHSIETASASCGVYLLRLNGDLKSARAVSPVSIEFSYESSARAIATLDRAPRSLQIDGKDSAMERTGAATLLLPAGRHAVTITVD